MSGSSTGGRAYGGVSAAERDAVRRRRLLDAGLTMFGTIGFRNTTVRGLCREARVADRNFYELFPSLEELLEAVYQDCIGRLMSATLDAISALPAGSDIATVAHTGLDAFFTVCEDTALAQTVWLEVLGVSDRMNTVYLTAMESFGELLLGRAQGVTDTETSRALVTAAVGAISHTSLTWYLSGYRMDRADLVASSARILSSIAVLAADEQA